MEKTRAVELNYIFKIICLSFNSQKKFIRLQAFLPLRILPIERKTLYLHPSTVTKYQKRISGPMLDRISPRFADFQHHFPTHKVATIGTSSRYPIQV